MIAIDRQRLLDARTGVKHLLVDALACLASRTQPNESWLDELLVQRVPADDSGYWLLQAKAAQNRAIGTAEGWLDHPDLPDDVRAHLVDLLSELLAVGSGAELTEERLPAVIADVLGRPVDVHELDAPIEFVLAILTLTTDSSVHAAVIGV